MNKVNNRNELNDLRDVLRLNRATEESKKVVIRIAMATCSIASGSTAVLEAFTEQMPRHPAEYLIKSTGCTGLCHSEPTVEITRPGSPPVMFGKVDVPKVAELINTFIIKGEPVDGVVKDN